MEYFSKKKKNYQYYDKSEKRSIIALIVADYSKISTTSDVYFTVDHFSK